MKRSILGSLAVAPLLGLIASPGLVPAGEPGEGGFTDGNTAFACDLYKAVATGKGGGAEGGNVFFSPYSISTAFGMLRAGARGPTAEQVDKVFHFPADAGPSFRTLVAAFSEPRRIAVREGDVKRDLPVYELSVANGLWSQAGWSFEAEFRRAIAEDYGGEFAELDFKKGEEARAAINRWIEQKTKDKIKDLIPAGQPGPDTRLILANAVYFKAAWMESFEKVATKTSAFHAGGGDVQAPLMNQTERFPYADAGDVQVLEMPYLGGETSMLVVLPKAADGLPAVEAGLSSAKVLGWIKALKSERVAVTFPKFKYTRMIDLGTPLMAMGLTLPFDGQNADFTGISKDTPLVVTAAIHKAFVAVDEEGTEAAAATAISFGATAVRPSEPVAFTADHPFLFAIRHRATGTILFLGRVSDPTKE